MSSYFYSIPFSHACGGEMLRPQHRSRNHEVAIIGSAALDGCIR